MLLEMDQDTFPESRITQPAGVRYIFDQSIGQDVRHVHSAGEHPLDGGGSPLGLPVQAHGGNPGGGTVDGLQVQKAQHQDQGQGDPQDQHQKLGLQTPDDSSHNATSPYLLDGKTTKSRLSHRQTADGFHHSAFFRAEEKHYAAGCHFTGPVSFASLDFSRFAKRFCIFFFDYHY